MNKSKKDNVDDNMHLYLLDEKYFKGKTKFSNGVRKLVLRKEE